MSFYKTSVSSPLTLLVSSWAYTFVFIEHIKCDQEFNKYKK